MTTVDSLGYNWNGKQFNEHTQTAVHQLILNRIKSGKAIYWEKAPEQQPKDTSPEATVGDSSNE